MFNTIFKVLDKGQTASNTDIDKISPYIFAKWLGNNRLTVLAANKLNLYSNIPIRNQYQMIKDSFAGKQLYIKYPKTQKDETLNDDVIAYHFKISLTKAKDYREFMSEQEIQNLVEMYESIDIN